jgi:ATP synthase protein I
VAYPLSPEQREQPPQREQAGQFEQPGQFEQEALLQEPPGRPLLQEPPDQPATGARRAPVFRGRRGADADGQASPLPARGAGWTILSYLIAGMIAYGAIGWLVGRAVHETVIFPVGMLFGLGVSIGLVIYRYGRSSSTKNKHAEKTLREEPAGDR